MLTRYLDSHIQLMLTSYLITMLVCAFSLCYLLIKSERSQLRSSFTVVQIVMIVWLIFALRERISLTHAELLLNMRITLTSVTLTAPLLLITILNYTMHLTKNNRWLIPIILVVPVILCIPMLFPANSGIFSLYIKELIFDETARVYYVTWGPFELIAGIVASCDIIICACSLYIYFRNSKTITLNERVIALLVLFSSLAARFFGLAFDAPFDLTPLAFSLWGVTTVYLSYKRQFLNAVPSLVWNVFNVTKDSIAVLGADGSVNLNKSFEAEFGNRDSDILCFAEELSPELRECIRYRRDASCLEAKKNGVYYEASVHNVFGKRRKIVGQLVMIKDVTESKQLTLVNERTRIASGLHNSMGNRLVASINNLNLALIQPTLEKSTPFIDTALSSTIESLMMLRRIVEGLSPVDFNEARLITLIESVVDRIAASGIHTNLQVDCEPEDLSIGLKEFIYETCQEALTNSIIHGKAGRVNIKLGCADDMLRLEIVDDGRGCGVISKSGGLTAMEDGAIILGGKIRFGSPASGGFGIVAEVPITAGENE